MMSDFGSTSPRRPRPYRRPDLPAPLNWPLLDRVDWQRPVVVEVGCGTGEWSIQSAHKTPGTQFIAIERTLTRSQVLIKNAESAHLDNLFAIRADAVLLLAHRCPANSVESFYFFYPNPYPPKRLAHLRYFTGSSFEVFDRCLKPGGSIVVTSNIEEYIREAESYLQSIWGYSTCRSTVISPQQAPRTAFERKYQARKESLFELCVRK